MKVQLDIQIGKAFKASLLIAAEATVILAILALLA